MEMFFLLCAGIGGTLMVCQLIATLTGMGGEDGASDHGSIGGHEIGSHEMGHDGSTEASSHETGHHTASYFFGLLSFRALSAAATFFGLAGLAGIYGELGEGPSVALGLGSGAIAIYLVSTMMRWMANLKSDGTVRIERAVGTIGTVYLRIPGQRSGVGKVTLSLQGRTVEYQAVTPHEEIPATCRVQVTQIVNHDTVEVILATLETPTHV